VAVRQHWDAVEPIGVTDVEPLVNLDIGSGRGSHTVGGKASRAIEAQVTGDSDVGDRTHHAATGQLGGGGKLTRTAGWTAGRRVNHVTLIESGGRTAKFWVPHTVVVSRVLPGGGLEELFTHDGGTEIGLPVELLPEDPAVRPPAPEPEPRPASYRVLRRATLLHQGERVSPDHRSAFWDSVGEVTEDAAAAGYVHLNQTMDIRHQIAHPEALWTGYGTDLAVTTGGFSTVRHSLTLAYQVGGARFVGTVPLLLGDINLTAGVVDTQAGRELGVSGGVTTGVGFRTGEDGPDADHTPDGTAASDEGSEAVTRSTGRSRTWSQAYARERLVIHNGIGYVFVAPATARATAVAYRMGRRVERTADSDGHLVVFAHPEPVAIELFLAGELALPVRLVADAILRFAAGHLDLDPGTAVRLVRRYRAELAARPYPGLPDADFRNLDGVAVRLAQRLADLHHEPPGHLKAPADQIDYFLALPDEPPTVRVPEPVRDTLGESAFDHVELTDEAGVPVDLAEEVMRQIHELVPDAAERLPGLWQYVSDQVSGRRWYGHVDDMIRRTYRLHLPIPIGQYFVEPVTVRLEFGFDDPEHADLLGGTRQVLLIDQVYGYAGVKLSESTGWEFRDEQYGTLTSGEPDALRRETGGGFGMGYTATGSTEEQTTRIYRVGTFTGAQRIRQPVRLTVEVSRSRPFIPRPVQRLADFYRRGRPDPSVSLTGVATRFVPAGLLAAGESGRLLYAGRVRLPEETFPSGHHTGRLREVVGDRLAQPDLLGRGAAEVAEALDGHLSVLAGDAALVRMNGPLGHSFRLTRPSDPEHVWEVWVRADASQVRTAAPSRDDTQTGRVRRLQRTAGEKDSRRRALPVSRALGRTDAPLGIHQRLATGAQAADDTTRVAGNRDETSSFEEGTVASLALRMTYHVTIVKLALDRHGDERTVRRVHLPWAATGSAHVTLPAHDLAAMLREARAGGDRPDWRFG
jgi:hypothetical protein